MRILKTIPENREFFNEHGASLAKYQLIGLIGQLLSGLSLAYAVYSLLVAQTSGTAPPWITIILALVVGIFIELANRVLARPAIKPYVIKDQFSEDPDQQQRHKILNRSYLVGLVCVALLSYLLSGVGSNSYAKDSSPPPELSNTDSIEQVFALRNKSALQTYQRDSATIAEPYQIRHQAALDRFSSDSLALMKERRKYNKCANKGNEWCKNQLDAFAARVDRSRASMADSLATIARQRSTALTSLLADRKSSVRQINKDKRTTINKAEESDTQLKQEAENDSTFMGIIFIILTVAGQTVFYYMTYLTLQVEAGSEITYEIEPNEFWNLPSTWEELQTGLSWRLERRARATLRKLYTPKKKRNTEILYKGLFNGANSSDSTNKDKQLNLNGKRSKNCSVNEDRSREGNTDSNVEEKRQRKKGEIGEIEQCDHCGNDYVRKSTRQRFCSTNCRMDHHAQKHNGKRFDEHILNGKSK